MRTALLLLQIAFFAVAVVALAPPFLALSWAARASCAGLVRALHTLEDLARRRGQGAAVLARVEPRALRGGNACRP